MATRSEVEISDEVKEVSDHQALIDLIAAYPMDGIAEEQQAAYRDFMQAFFANVPLEELAALPVERLRTMVESCWQFTAKRPLEDGGGHAKVRVFNPDLSDTPGRPITVLEIVTRDTPFIVASLLAEINERDLGVSFLAHPIVPTHRSSTGLRVREEEASWSDRESVVHIELTLLPSEAECEALEARLLDVLGHVRMAVEGWQEMSTRLTEAVQEMDGHGAFLPPDEVEEAVSFLNWLSEDHFLLFGARDYVLKGSGDEAEMVALSDTSLGILHDPDVLFLRRTAEDHGGITPFISSFLSKPEAIVVAKSNTMSLVHRRAYMDYIGIKTYSSSGELTGERRFIGLFTSAAYNRSTRDIPYVRRKVRLALEEAGFESRSHDGNALLNVIENFPRDEIFQIDVDQLAKTSIGILRLMERPRTKVFIRRDPFDRFVTAMVYFPRDRFGTDLRTKVGEALAEHFKGRLSAFYTQMGDAVLARVHYIIGRTPGSEMPASDAEADRLVVSLVRSWRDKLYEVLQGSSAYQEAQRLFHRYRDAFSEAYKEAFSPEEAALDIQAVEGLSEDNPVAVRVYREAGDQDFTLRLKIYHYGVSIPLSRSIPILENMGLRVLSEFSYKSLPRGGADDDCAPRFIYDFVTEQDGCDQLSLETLSEVLAPAFVAVWRGDAENDGFNRLIVSPGLGWRDVAILRAAAKYRLQTGIAFSQSYMQEALAENPSIAANLVELFKLRFDPELPGTTAARSAASETIRQSILRALAQVPSLDQDRIMRRLLNLIEAMLRTNFFQRDRSGAEKSYISFKLDASKIEELPEPRPYAEIFVYSPRVEGVHLRYAPIARGGLRWSDRREDFRTEILGLAKAQQVKNSVIVPQGAKGGFFPKQLPQSTDRAEIQEEAIAAYKIFVSGLLDLTDNLDLAGGGAIVPPPHVVAFDDPDPYLVVAADKGTATFSDIANGISKDYGFWLGDAFASGGSQGYDHKAMGITARGAWEAVKRHFRELGRDIQTSPFTAIGVGDMSGDVFGNGMLLSKQTRLVAAFDHRDIFIDPKPDEASSWVERKRLYDLPRSSWDDYDRALISEGGGVFSRSMKSIPLTDEIRHLLGIEDQEIAPNDLIRAILKAEADLLWFGGIGTYLKAPEQSNLDAGDRANDAIRINVDELKVKVVGEGANLGCTQLGRIAFARAGGCINMDAIDNAAGVDCSDHEVNIKILLDSAMAAGKLGADERNDLLVDMTSSVSELVLRNNYDQTLAITLVEGSRHEDRDADGRVMRALERDGLLDRDLEFLPSDDDLAELAERGLGLVRPELSILMSYTKIALCEDLLASDLPDDPYLGKMLTNYFPRVLCERFADEIQNHRLRREIIATELSNQIVNLGGITFIHRIQEMTGAEPAQIARAFVVVRALFSLGFIRDRINAMDNKIDAEVQSSMHRVVKELAKLQTAWFVTSGRLGTISETIERYQAGIKEVHDAPRSVVSGVEIDEIEGAIESFVQKGVDEELASEVAILMPLAAACDMVEVAEKTHFAISDVAEAYFLVGAQLRLDRLRLDARRVSAGEHWDRLAIKRIGTDMAHYQRKLVEFALAHQDNGEGAVGRVAAWISANDGCISRFKTLYGELEASGGINIAKLSLLSSQMRDLVHTLEMESPNQPH